jgi:hypothetical protein
MTQTVRLKSDRRAQPRIPPPDTARTTPEDGDIVVREETRHGAVVYVLHATPRTHHDLVGSRREAIARARALAKRMCVRAWQTREGYDFTLLEDFRVATANEEGADMPRPKPATAGLPAKKRFLTAS